MALDTDDKRLAVMNPMSPWRGLWPLPNGDVGAGDRAQFLFLSRDLAFGDGADGLDAADEVRLSYMNIMSPWRGLLPLPGAGLAAADRAQVLFLARQPAAGAGGGFQPAWAARANTMLMSGRAG